jgi:regulator of sigma E protease
MGGIIVNVITGIIIFILLTYQYGETYRPREEVIKYGIVAHDFGKKIGLETGDKILNVNGEEYKRFTDLVAPEVLLGDSSYYTVLREDDTLTVPIPSDLINDLSDREAAGNFISMREPYKVVEVLEGSPADQAGLQPGDKIVSVNDEPVEFFDQLQTILSRNAGEQVELKVIRGNEDEEENEDVPLASTAEPVQLDATVGEDGKLGFRSQALVDLAFTDYSLAQSIPKGTTEAFNVVWINVKAIGKIFSGEVSASKSLSGPIGIAQIFGGTWEWYRFWRITGLLSMVLAFMNFLPIPALDGGHVAFLTYEIVSGRRPSDKFLEGAQKVGMVILLSLMTFAIFNDIFKVIF